MVPNMCIQIQRKEWNMSLCAYLWISPKIRKASCNWMDWVFECYIYNVCSCKILITPLPPILFWSVVFFANMHQSSVGHQHQRFFFQHFRIFAAEEFQAVTRTFVDAPLLSTAQKPLFGFENELLSTSQCCHSSTMWEGACWRFPTRLTAWCGTPAPATARRSQQRWKPAAHEEPTAFCTQTKGLFTPAPPLFLFRRAKS